MRRWSAPASRTALRSDSGDVILAPVDGEVVEVTGDHIVVKGADDNKKHRMALQKFERSNQGTCINQKPLVARARR